MAAAALPITSPEEYRRVYNQAENLLRDGHLPEAAECYRDLLGYWLEWEQREPGLPFTLNEFYVVDRLADLSLMTGNKTAARQLLAAMAKLGKRVGNQPLRIHAATKWLFVNLHDSLLDAACNNVNSLADVIGDLRDIKITPAGLSDWEGRVQFDPDGSGQDEADQFVCLYDALGALLLALGRFGEAVLMFGRGIGIGEQFPSPVVGARLLPLRLLRARALFEKGEIASAKAALAALDPEADAAPVASGTAVHLLELRSRIALAQGDMGEAYELLFATVELCQQYRLPLAEIHAQVNLAQTKVLLNQVDEAADILTHCLREAERLEETALAGRITRFLQVADNRVRITMPVLNHGSARQNRFGGVRESQSPGPVGPAEYRRSANYLSHCDEKALLLQLYLTNGQADKATQVLSELTLLIREGKCDSVLVIARRQVLEFMLLYCTNAPIPANWSFEPVLAFMSANGLLPELWQFRQWLWHTHLVPGADKATWIAENQRLLDQITGTLDPTMQTLYLLNKWSPNEEYLASRADQLLRVKQKKWNAKSWFGRWAANWELTKSLHGFQAEANRYKDHLARNVANGQRPGAFTFAGKQGGVLARLWAQPRHALTVSFLVLPDRIVIASRSFLKMRLHVTFISRVTLRQLVFRLRDQLYPQGVWKGIKKSVLDTTTDPGPDMTELLAHFGKLLQVETLLQEHGTGIRLLTFLADDVLHGFPFTLLTAYGRPLAENFRISLSTDDAPEAHRKVGFAGKKVLLAGVSEGFHGLNALPGVVTEIAGVSSLLQREGAEVKKLMNEEATPQEIMKQLPQVVGGHFSCHGKFDYQHPDQSGLLLAGGQMLTLKDILSAGDLSQVRLLVLSSCRGAEHYILPGRWVIGLPETFCRAGVKAVLAFLWPVEDSFATAFTTRFYEHLRQHTPAEAFRCTVLNAIRKELSDLRMAYWQPEFWAGAVLYQR